MDDIAVRVSENGGQIVAFVPSCDEEWRAARRVVDEPRHEAQRLQCRCDLFSQIRSQVRGRVRPLAFRTAGDALPKETQQVSIVEPSHGARDDFITTGGPTCESIG